MADLKDNNPTTNNAENINSDIVQSNGVNTNLGETNQVEKMEQTPVYESSQINPTSEKQPESTPAETPNNEIILGKFDNAMINTVQEQEIAPQQDIPSPEQSSVQETPTNEESNIEDSQKSKTTQKEKLLQLIKVHESKAKTKGFATGILSGVVLSIGILALSYLFAKDQIINLLNGENENPSLSANVVELNINALENENNEDNENVLPENDAEINDENIDDYEDINEEFDEPMYYENYEDSENILTENNEELDNENFYDNTDYEDINEEFNEPVYYEDLNENSETSKNILSENDEEIINQDNEIITNEETSITEYKETSEDEPDISEYDSSSNEESSKYSITHVSSTGEANWVLPSHCTDLTCYGEDKEFSPCITFRLTENLDENARRIGKNGACKYKDASELVYVEFHE